MNAQRGLAIAVLVVAVVGFVFASVSTSDFTAHLDRQVHAIHCSFVPGADTPDVSGTSGCHLTMMSPYSSVMRDSVWGGIPVSLPGMAVFAYLVFLAAATLLGRRERDARVAGYQALSWALPFCTSLVFGYLSLHELGAACKLCIGIYSSSTIGLVLAVVMAVRARSGERITDTIDDVEERMSPPAKARRVDPDAMEPDEAPAADKTLPDGSMSAVRTEEIDAQAETAIDDGGPRVRLATASQMDRKLRSKQSAPAPMGPRPVGWGVLGAAFAAGVMFVLVPVMAYAAGAPDFSRFIGNCGTLAHPDAQASASGGSIFVALGPQTRQETMTEVLDPLCPACRAFENRFSQHRAAEELSRRAVLFPLDHDCNWMIETSLHPGACVVSEAVLCAEGDAEEVLGWAFENQEALHEAATGSGGSEAVGRMVRERFPSLASCIGSAQVEARLNRSLRWAVANQLPVLTPQVYVNDVRMCDEDTDLGLDYALTRLMEREATHGGAR